MIPKLCQINNKELIKYLEQKLSFEIGIPTLKRLEYIIDSYYIYGVLKIIYDERFKSAARYISQRDYRRLCGREAIMMSSSVNTNK